MHADCLSPEPRAALKIVDSTAFGATLTEWNVICE
jgi:hypothetical protein